MMNIDYWINQLNLLPHPEGGYYKEMYRSSELVASSALPDRFEGDRYFSTAIYFLLRSEDRSVFHRIKSDEVWHFYQGSTLLIYVLEQNELKIYRLGSDLEKGESLQVVIPANCWFGADVEKQNSFALCGCTVAPGFDFRDFEMARQEELLAAYPKQSEIILRLTNTSRP
jgi:predicted cupin superfamily sugar epimerase